MKNEEFNEFLRQKAGEFELKPSSGSFDSVMRKMDNQRKKRRNIILWLPMSAAAAVAALLAVFVYTGTEGLPLGPAAQKTLPAAENPVAKEAPAPQQSTGATTEVFDTPDITTTKTPANNTTANGKQNNGGQGNGYGEGKPALTQQLYEQKTLPALPLPNAENDTTYMLADAPVPAPPDEEAPNMPILADIPVDSMPAVANIEPESKKDKKGGCNCNNGKWSVQAYYNPFNVSYHEKPVFAKNDYIASSPGTAPADPPITYYKEDMALGGMETGIKAARKISDRWSIVAGLGYNKYTVQENIWAVATREDSVQVQGFDNNNQFVNYYASVSPSQKIQKTEVQTTHHSVQVPLMAQYSYTKKRWGFSLQMGTILGYIFRNDATTEQYNLIAESNSRLSITSQGITPSSAEAITYNANNEAYRAFNVQLAASTQLTYQPHKCVEVFAGPRAGLSLLSAKSETQNSESKKYTSFVGIETGVKFIF